METPGHDPLGPHETHEHLVERLREAAIEAELATGAVEETEAEARAHVLVRLGRMALGFTVLLAGLAMLALPGPGWLVIAAGLAILSRDVAWAERTLDRVRRRLPQDADGKLPRHVVASMVLLGVAGVAASLYFML